MARIDINRSGEMEVFVRVVERGSFSAAARALGMTPSAVSKLVARLEARLGARLVNRSTRRLQLTPEGAAFYENGLRILADIDEAEREAAAGAMPRGRLRVNCNVPFGQHYLLPLLPRFLERYPEIVVDVVADRQRRRPAGRARRRRHPRRPVAGIAAGGAQARQSRMVIVGAPAYLATIRDAAHAGRSRPATIASTSASRGWSTAGRCSATMGTRRW